MAEDIIKTLGPTKASKNDAGGGVLRSEPVIGVVKNNIDPIRQGRIQVWVQDMNGSDSNDSKGWVTVSYLSNFYGKTYGSANGDNYGTYSTNPVSYGEWHSPPDIGTRVVCIFVNGDPNYGYYIGAIPEPESLTMVPAIGSVDSKVILNAGEANNLAGATQLPVTNINADNTSLSESNDFLNSAKPVHSYVAATLSQQGLIRDTVRGTVTSSSQRETPSRVGWGVSTPGRPIYEGGYTDENIVDAASGSNPTNTKIVSRRAGHSIVMDDGNILGKDQLIRLRTALGHQILMSDDGQCLFIIHANGQSWIELGKEGTIDMYATNSVNIRTQGDLNLHADNNINIQADKNINIKAKENITVNADQDLNIRTSGNFKQHTSGNHATKTDGQMSMSSAGDASYASSGSTFINGSKVNLNTGSSSLNPAEVKPLVMFTHTDTLFDAEKGFVPAPGKLQTIASRAPAHHPWINANQGVDVKTKLDAAGALPAPPSPQVEKTNATVPATPTTPVSESLVATVPGSEKAGENIGLGTTAALVSSTAASAATQATAAVTAGSAIVEGKVAVGQLAQSAQQLVAGGSVKPGADRLINGLAQAGATVEGALTSNMFTGKSGVSDLQSLVTNTGAQVTNMVNNIKTVEKQLVNSGVISGLESPTATAGLILSGVQNGVQQTVDFAKNIGSAAAAGLGQLTGAAGKIADSISLGNLAGNLQSSVSGALGGLKDKLGGLVSKATDPLTAGFDAIKNAYKPFKPNVPQDLKAIAEQNTAETESQIDPYEGLSPDQIESLGTADPTDPFIRNRLGLPALTGSPVLAGGNLPGGLQTSINSISTNVSAAATNITSSVTSTLNNAKSSVSSAIDNIKNLDIAKTGLQGIPGGQKGLSNVVDMAAGAVSKIPGADTLGSAINNGAAGLLNNTSGQIMAEASKAAGLLGSAQQGLTSGLSSLTGALSSIQNTLKANAGSLVGIASSVLPKSLSTQLTAAINSVAANSPNQLKIPTVAVNTVDRASVDSQITGILGNSKIPPPTYSSPLTSYLENETKKLEEQRKKRAEIQKRADVQFKVAMDAKKEYTDAINNLPEGDPGIQEAREKFIAERKKWEQIAIVEYTDA